MFVVNQICNNCHKTLQTWQEYIDGSVQDCGKSSALAMGVTAVLH